ncbi:50S ribosomal protein L21 [Blochmannia endosymbiont of Polyrhachis (Hedomyrma) turneri]|uniref:50S ribosomal protein L21 n=1 Tax=Blochmannia endosymbiont of Polyrhachis (Hedomyrma) turneri TaxID=1505596 RepID=UPI00061A709F|nr:50S ribosomal protein L21 [Blochmannia endosymbiont of Polyrhachis (Hedomyrma) turneri]AKC59679.1 50S ribosomal protein L21 [Blochmannia endosymbiont of Polyrhachis (Hedomyrma) turneri]
MYAIFQNGGKQYRVSIGTVVRLEKIDLPVGEMFKCNQVMMIAHTGGVQFGRPFLMSCNILGEVVRHGRFSKIMIIKFRRRKHFRKFQGHRQFFTDVKINTISVT